MTAATEHKGMSRTQSVEVGFDSEFLNRWLKYEKTAWGAIALFIAAGVAGLLGRGPLSKAKVASGDDGLKLTYERVARNKTPAVLEILLPRQLPSADRVRLRLDGDLVRRGRFQRIIPQPIASEPLPQGLVIEVRLTQNSAAGKITVVQEPSAPGVLSSRVSLEGGPSLSFEQFILP